MKIEPGDIGGIVRHHRRRAGLSRIQLARLAGVGKTLIYDIERGKISVRLDSLHKVLAVLNISMELESPLMHELQETKE